MLILGIETSCDETSISVVRDGKEVLSNIISSQIDIHKEFGGVVPEIASRHHIKNISAVYEEAMTEARVTLDDIDYIAVTYAPGLIGALLVGISFAKGLAYGKGIPIIPVHHIKGHIYANFIENRVELPAISLVVSGGHTNLIHIDENHKFSDVGGTLDDAVGESYDKVARVLGLGYPGGPVVDRLSKLGDPNSFKITKPKVDRFDFSFSGVKTNIINQVNKLKMKGEEINNEDLCASFQKTVVDILTEKTIDACKEYKVKNLLLAGGVAANSEIRLRLKESLQDINVEFIVPSFVLCTDNAAMIAAAAYYKLKYQKDYNDDILSLNGKPNLKVVED